MTCVFAIITAVSLCCGWSVAEESDEDAPDGAYFTVYSADQEPRRELFYQVCESDYAVAYVSAHAVDEAAANKLLECFEERIYPELVLPSLRGEKLCVLLTCMEGQVYGYAPFPEPEQGPTVCLNALYPDALSYALAHEYQHLCAFEACEAGDTALSEETDELLSDMFCELLFPDQGRQQGILTEQRAEAAQARIEAWGEDAVSYAHTLLREGYPENDLLSAMEDR